MRILFTTARFPYPPLRGDQVRAYHQLRILGRRHAVTLLSATREKIAPDALRHVEDFCTQVIVEPLTTVRALRGLGRLVVGDPRPVQTQLYSGVGGHALRSLLTGGSFDLLHAQLVRTAGWLPLDPMPARMPIVIDLVDALSASYRRRLEIEQRWWKRTALSFEARRLERYEADLVSRGANCVLVSDRDRRDLGVPTDQVAVNANGVDLVAFSFAADSRDRNGIVFVGNLGYAPNSDGIHWFTDEVLPRVQGSLPDVELRIVGPRAGRRVRRLARRRGVEIAGVVPDVHAALSASAVAVAPLRVAAGIQNKILEAMASGVPVVATGAAVAGLNVRANEHVLVADEPREFARAVELLLRRPDLRARLAASARELVERGYSWEASVEELEELYGAALADHQSRERGAAPPVVSIAPSTSVDPGA